MYATWRVMYAGVERVLCVRIWFVFCTQKIWWDVTSEKKEKLKPDSWQQYTCTHMHTQQKIAFFLSRGTEARNKGRTLRRWAKRTRGGRSKGNSGELETWQNLMLQPQQHVSSEACSFWKWDLTLELLSISFGYFCSGLRGQLVDVSWFTVPQACDLKIITFNYNFNLYLSDKEPHTQTHADFTPCNSSPDFVLTVTRSWSNVKIKFNTMIWSCLQVFNKNGLTFISSWHCCLRVLCVC